MDDAKDINVKRNGTHSQLSLCLCLCSAADTADFVKRPITSRAHLLDIPRYLTKHSLPPLSYFSAETPISVEILDACAKDQGLSFAPGDILVLRTGFTEAEAALTHEEKVELAGRARRETCGVDQGEDTLKWHWENGFAAVACDK